MYFDIADGRSSFYQWDIDRKMIVTHPEITELHYCNGSSDTALVCAVVDGLADVPNVFMQTAGTLRVYGYAADHTEIAKVFRILPRTMPSDYVYTQTEIRRFETLEKAVQDATEAMNAQIKECGEAADNADRAAQNADEKASLANDKAGQADDAATRANGAANTASDKAALAEKATKNADDIASTVQGKMDRGEFDGEDGFSPTVTVQETETGHTVTVTDATGEHAFTVADGAPGRDGLDAPQVDDEAVSRSNPWSSLETVDRLCPAFDATGNPVQLYPVEGYPLGVKARVEPVQEGEGDPSPENVRPITVQKTVTVQRCGKNLIPVPMRTVTSNGITYTADGCGGIRISGTATAKSYYGATGQQYRFRLPAGTYRLSGSVAGVQLYIVNAGTAVNMIDIGSGVTFESSGSEDAYMQIAVNEGNTVDATIRPMLEVGAATTAYEPYRGDTYTIDLPEGFAGGAVDVTGGVASQTMSEADLSSAAYVGENTTNGLVNYRINLPAGETRPELTAFRAGIMSSGLPYSSKALAQATSESIFAGSSDTIFVRVLKTNAPDAAAFAAYVASIGLRIVYPLGVPIETTFAPQEINALDGVNTLLTNGVSLTVSGRGDPIHIIDAMEQRLAALEAAAVSE